MEKEVKKEEKIKLNILIIFGTEKIVKNLEKIIAKDYRREIQLQNIKENH
jgi:hypothetical protein